MTKPLTFTKASIKRAIAGAREAGLRVTAISLADGMVHVSDEPEITLASARVVTQNAEAPEDGWGSPQA